MPPPFATQQREQRGRRRAVSPSPIPDFPAGRAHAVHTVITLHAIMGYCSLELACASGRPRPPIAKRL